MGRDIEDMQPRADQVWFCNNPGCPRCDIHLRGAERLVKDGRHVCPACHEELTSQRARPREPRLPARQRAARSVWGPA
jgi:transposase-like protein